MSVSSLLIVVTIYTLMLAAFVSQKTRHRQSGRLLAWFFFWVGLWTACTAVITYPESRRETVLIFSRAMFFCATCFAIFGLWFCTVFPYSSRTYSRITLFLALLGIPWLGLCWTGGLIENLTGEPWGEYAVTGYLFPYFGIWVTITTGTMVVYLVQKLKKSHGVGRLQIGYILFGLIGTWLGGMTCNLLLPYFAHTTVYAASGPLSSLFITTAASYAILRHRLMDIKFILRFILVYSLTIGILATSFAILYLLLNRVMVEYFRFPAPFMGVILSLCIVALFHPLLQGIQRVVNTYIFKTIDYRSILRETSQAFASVRATQLIIDILMQAIVQTLRPMQIAIFLPDSKGVLERYVMDGSWDELPGLLPEHEPVLVSAVEKDDVLITEELLELPTEEREIGLRLQSWNACIALPLVAGKQLCGIVLLGEKHSGSTYSLDDTGLLRILSKQAATALDNAHHYEALRRANMQLEERVHERTHQLAVTNDRLAIMNEQLETANTALKAADKAKDEFLAVLSHELKTPLTCILAWAEVARYESDPSIIAKSLSIIKHNALRQRHLLNDLLDVSRIIHNKLLLHPEPADLWSIAQQVADDLEQAALERQVMLILEPPGTVLLIIADPARMAQVIMNVVNNALKFTEPGGRVVMTGRREGDTAVLRVTDTGRGIPPERLPDLFLPFRQVERIESNGGLGLGLALANGITELHGGQISAASAGLGQGSTFTLTLPLADDEVSIHDFETLPRLASTVSSA